MREFRLMWVVLSIQPFEDGLAATADPWFVLSVPKDQFSRCRPVSLDGIRVKKYKINAESPLAVLNSLARIAGLFNDRLQLEGDDEVVAILQSARNRIAKGEDE